MQKYWINKDGVQSGPFTETQLQSIEINDETYVWRSGLEGWLKIDELPEYDEIFNATPEPQVEEPEVLAAEPQELEVLEEPVAEDEPEAEVVAVQETVAEQASESEVEEETTPPAVELPPPVSPELFEASFVNRDSKQSRLSHLSQASQPTQPSQQAQASQDEKPKCPPSNLVWAIIATVLFTTILGAIAIVYAIKVKKKYNRQDYVGAERCSTRGAWWCIGSIVAHFLLMPVSLLLGFLQ